MQTYNIRFTILIKETATITANNRTEAIEKAYEEASKVYNIDPAFMDICDTELVEEVGNGN